MTDDERYLAFTRHLRALRKQHGLSCEALGRKSGITSTTISMIENNYKGHAAKVRGTTLMQLSRALGLPDSYLADYLENPGDPDRLPPANLATDFDDEVLDRLDGLGEKLGTLDVKIDHLVIPSKISGSGSNDISTGRPAAGG